MNVFIVTEAGKKIGFGHLSRCAALYDAFKLKKISPVLIVNGDAASQKTLGTRNHLRFNWLKSSSRLIGLIKDADIMVIDSYLADQALFRELARQVKLAAYIDDTKRLNYPKGVVINGNAYGTRVNYPRSTGMHYLLGPEYSLLRKDFWNRSSKKIEPEVTNVLVTFGG